MPQRRTNSLSENGVAEFLFEPQWVWVPYPSFNLAGEDLADDERFHGFAVEVLANLSGYQARAHDVALRAYLAVIARISEADPELKPTGLELDEAEDRYLENIAWRVRAWNWRERNIAGEVVKVPPPAEAGFEAFYVIPPELRTWTIRVLRAAARPKATIPRSSPAGSSDTITLTTMPQGPTPPSS